MNQFIDDFSIKSIKKLKADPIWKLYDEVITIYLNDLEKPFTELGNTVKLLDRTYMQGLIDMKKDKVFYPDANLPHSLLLLKSLDLFWNNWKV